MHTFTIFQKMLFCLYVIFIILCYSVTVASPQACMRDIPGCKWLDQWTELAQKCVNITLEFIEPLTRWSLRVYALRQAVDSLILLTCIFYSGLRSSTTRLCSRGPWWCSAASVSEWLTVRSNRSSESSARPAPFSASTGWVLYLTLALYFHLCYPALPLLSVSLYGWPE